MDPQTGLPRALLLLLFLHLMPLGGRSHPLGGPSPGPPLELSRVQELRDHLPGTVGEQQEEQTALEPLQQGRSSKAAGAARQAASAAGLGPRDHVLQSPKRMHDSGCFGGRMDRIGFSTGLGCNGELPPTPPPPLPWVPPMQSHLGMVSLGTTP
ncbi:Natriuretic peptides B [Myotis brandtii]|uniref:Natriuretic peptides B n=1 Tax=Myotis brandtii TaxID=109478 RepID=S7PUJ3_MYOBR|nr:Natriuretic peptides B [Myotis brandtii]